LGSGRGPIAGVARAAGELLTLQPPWHTPAEVSQFITQEVKACTWGWIEGRDGGTGGTVTVCCARRTGGLSSSAGAEAHTTPRTKTPTASLELTRTSLPHFQPQTYRILHRAVYTLWKRKRLAMTAPVRFAWRADPIQSIHPWYDGNQGSAAIPRVKNPVPGNRKNRHNHQLTAAGSDLVNLRWFVPCASSSI
jgi:hypothetical protein